MSVESGHLSDQSVRIFGIYIDYIRQNYAKKRSEDKMRARDTQHANYRCYSRVFKSVLGTDRTFESTRTYKKLLTDIS